MHRFGDAAELVIPFLWLGMVLAISFLEAPLKFRAPGISLPLGLGIGRLVFRAPNVCESILAILLVVASLAGRQTSATVALTFALVATLTIQLVVLRPGLDRRAQAVIAGADRAALHRHQAYIGLELVKVTLLILSGGILVTTVVP